MSVDTLAPPSTWQQLSTSQVRFLDPQLLGLAQLTTSREALMAGLAPSRAGLFELIPSPDDPAADRSISVLYWSDLTLPGTIHAHARDTRLNEEPDDYFLTMTRGQRTSEADLVVSGLAMVRRSKYAAFGELVFDAKPEGRLSPLDEEIVIEFMEAAQKESEIRAQYPGMQRGITLDVMRRLALSMGSYMRNVSATQAEMSTAFSPTYKLAATLFGVMKSKIVGGRVYPDKQVGSLVNEEHRQIGYAVKDDTSILSVHESATIPHAIIVTHILRAPGNDGQLEAVQYQIVSDVAESKRAKIPPELYGLETLPQAIAAVNASQNRAEPAELQNVELFLFRCMQNVG